MYYITNGTENIAEFRDYSDARAHYKNFDLKNKNPDFAIVHKEQCDYCKEILRADKIMTYLNKNICEKCEEFKSVTTINKKGKYHLYYKNLNFTEKAGIFCTYSEARDAKYKLADRGFCGHTEIIKK